MFEMTRLLIPIAICVVLPVLIVWLVVRAKINKDNAQKDILLAAIEKNPNLDAGQFIQSMDSKKKLLKEKLLSKLLWGMMTLFVGLGFCIIALIASYAGGWDSDLIYFNGFAGASLIAIGVAFLVNYFVGKKFLAKEIEAEEQAKP